MQSVDQKIQELKALGYDPVYAYVAEPHEEDEDHEHSFDTKLIVMEGEILIRTNAMENILRIGQEIDIPQKQTHYAKVGSSGCTYIIAEKH